MSESSTLPPNTDTPPAGAGKLYELVDGRVAEPADMGAFETQIASDLMFEIRAFLARGRSGRVNTEMLYWIDRGRKLQRRPGVSFVSFERWPKERAIPKTAAWDVVPDLAVEVVSPTNSYGHVMDKLAEYFLAGVRSVWVVYPRGRTVSVYDGFKRVTIFEGADELDGGEVLPGFRLRLGELFDETAGDGSGDQPPSPEAVSE